mgnify:CR=1 FL=1
MNSNEPFRFKSVLERVSIWTIINHNFLAGQIRIYIWSASATVLFLAVASIIPLHTALYLLLFCGFAIMILLWSLIKWRKAILLDIQNPAMKKTAHAAMLALISSKSSQRNKMKKKTVPHYRWFRRKSHQ